MSGEKTRWWRLRRTGRPEERVPAGADGLADDAGVIAVITALLSVVLLVFAAFAVDVGRWYSEGERLQRTVDAAALAGAPYLPGDLGTARTAARALILKNGYTAPVPDADITIGDRPSRLQVTMSSTIPNAFGTIVGARFKTVTRSAVADFAATATGGSPCNVLGNEPPDSSGNTVGLGCPRSDLAYWNSLAGPATTKASGDRYATRSCESGNSNCLGTRNLDYSGGQGIFGQSYYVYRVSAKRSVSSLTIQAFDPMFVDVGEHCDAPGTLEQTPDGLWARGHPPIVSDADAQQRYAWGDQTTTPATSGKYCTGDTLVNRPADPAEAAAEAAKLTTTFLVLNPTATRDPLESSAACAPQSFHGFSGDLTKALVPGEPGYNTDDVAQYFRQWVDLCRVTSPARNLDYYVIVRTNVPYGASAARVLDPSEDPSTGGDGLNRFGLRVAVGGGSPSDVSISAVERLPLDVTVASGAVPYVPLARVPSASAGGMLTVTLFDFGDSPDGVVGKQATIQVKDPSLSPPAGCRATGGVRTGSLSSCAMTIPIQSGSSYAGKNQRIQVPIPDDYSCNDADPASCWFRLRIDSEIPFRDTMTWSVSLDGDPVRLVK